MEKKEILRDFLFASRRAVGAQIDCVAHSQILIRTSLQIRIGGMACIVDLQRIMAEVSYSFLLLLLILLETKTSI